jgi:SAM-dependent methyltransferase
MDAGTYGTQWDRYIGRSMDLEVEWPGDEWGDPAQWERLYQELFVAHGALDWKRAVEIGQGSGKYTLKVLQNPDVHVHAYDVSAKFLAVARERCAEHVNSGRLELSEIDASTPASLLDDLAPWRRQVDGFYSIDAMVHVDLQYLTAYLLTAAAVLRPGGKLILTVATATTDVGFQKLLDDVTKQWSDPLGKFEWLSGSFVESLLPRFGFDIDLLWEPQQGNSLSLVASLARPQVGSDLARYLRPVE